MNVTYCIILGINTFLKQTVKNCVKSGYVQTLMGRKRYLPGITNANVHGKAHVSMLNLIAFLCKNAIKTNILTVSLLFQAERQAVNTTVQGSAADIVKLATVNIQKQLRKIYPTAPRSHQHIPLGSITVDYIVSFDVCDQVIHISLIYYFTVTQQHRTCTSHLRGAYFVLQLHDELIYETMEEDLIQV